MRISFKLLGISEAVLVVAIIALLIPVRKGMHRQANTLDCDALVEQLRRELIAHCDGPSRTDDVTILCVDRV